MKQKRKSRENPYIYEKLIFDKGLNIIQWWKRIIFSTYSVGKIGYPYKKINFDLYLTPKWVIDLNVRSCKTSRRKHSNKFL